MKPFLRTFFITIIVCSFIIVGCAGKQTPPASTNVVVQPITVKKYEEPNLKFSPKDVVIKTDGGLYVNNEPYYFEKGRITDYVFTKNELYVFAINNTDNILHILTLTPEGLKEIHTFDKVKSFTLSGYVGQPTIEKEEFLEKVLIGLKFVKPNEPKIKLQEVFLSSGFEAIYEIENNKVKYLKDNMEMPDLINSMSCTGKGCTPKYANRVFGGKKYKKHQFMNTFNANMTSVEIYDTYMENRLGKEIVKQLSDSKIYTVGEKYFIIQGMSLLSPNVIYRINYYTGETETLKRGVLAGKVNIYTDGHKEYINIESIHGDQIYDVDTWQPVINGKDLKHVTSYYN